MHAEFLHVKPGKGAAFVRSKLKNYVTGNTVERTFRAGESVGTADIDRIDTQFTYGEGDTVRHQDDWVRVGLRVRVKVRVGIRDRVESLAIKLCFRQSKHGHALTGASEKHKLRARKTRVEGDGAPANEVGQLATVIGCVRQRCFSSRWQFVTSCML